MSSVDDATREQRLQDGCCPNCNTRLYKVSTTSAIGMPKMFKRNRSGSDPSSPKNATNTNNIKMVPLSIPGVVERGQCLKCANGVFSNNLMDAVGVGSGVGLGGGGGDTTTAVGVAEPVPTVKAVPVVVSPPPPNSGLSNDLLGEGGLKQPPPQDAPAFGELKQPPENLLGLKSPPETAAAASTSSAVDESSSSGSEEEESDSSESESGSDDSDDSSSSSGDDVSLEDVHDLLSSSTRQNELCRLESDHASSSLVNSLRRNSKLNDSGNVFDDRKPAAKTQIDVLEESNDRIRKLRLEAAAVDMAYLESATQGGGSDKLQCPVGMSPEVFYELPPDMQKEVMAQESRKSESSSSNNANDRTSSTASTTDIDPETLASLPDNIRQEVLEQARREQHKLQSNNNTSADEFAAATAAAAVSAPRPTLNTRKKNALSGSTTAFLSDIDINEEDYEKFPEEVKNDIMQEKIRRSSVSDGNDVDTSGYDPETLASLPEELRNEILEEERRKKEKRRRDSAAKKSPSAVGAHSVTNVPAGYDPETFAELPEEMKQELLDDAARRQAGVGGREYAADGYDYDSIVDAMVVPARPMSSGGGGTATSCTYEGEYNIMGKRHGDGELKWANGDKYVGKFKDGFIEGRGTISFHDGKLFV